MTDMSPPPPPPGRNDHGRVRALINQMIQLQDLVFARDQHEASMPGARLTQLDEAIETMLKQLPMDTASHFRRMRAKGLLAVVPIPNGVCSACAMMIPVSQVHAVRACDTIHQCPSCARYLYHPSSPARRIASRRRRSEPASAGIARFSSPALMIPRLAATTRDEAVAELCRKMGTEGFVDHADRLVEDALARGDV